MDSGPRILRNPDNGKKKFVVKTKACKMEIPWSISFYGGLNCLLFQIDICDLFY